MNYLMYAEVLEGGWWKFSDDLGFLISQWCNGGKRIFEVGELTQEEFDKWEKPRYPKVKSIFEVVYKEGNLLHEKE